MPNDNGRLNDNRITGNRFGFLLLLLFEWIFHSVCDALESFNSIDFYCYKNCLWHFHPFELVFTIWIFSFCLLWFEIVHQNDIDHKRIKIFGWNWTCRICIDYELHSKLNATESFPKTITTFLIWMYRSFRNRYTETLIKE